MLIYLDNCCFNRPFDDQSQLMISLETQAKLHVQKGIKDGKYQLIWSYVLEYENSKNPHDERRESILEWKRLAAESIMENDAVLKLYDSLILRGVKLYDALHVACAHIGNCDYFLTVDKALLKKPINEIKVINPIDFIREVRD